MKLSDVIIINDHTLKLNQDAYKGDEIDLLEINNVDLSIITNKINEQRDLEYNRRFDSLKREWELTKQNAINEALKNLNEENIKLKRDMELAEEKTRTAIEARYNLEINKLTNEIALLNKDLAKVKEGNSKDIDLALQKKEFEFKDQINLLKNKITSLERDKADELKSQDFEYQKKMTNLENDKKELELKFKLEKANALKQLEDSFEEKLKEQDEVINKLRLDKSSLNVKKMGEELEKWVDQEYQNNSLNGFDNCLWVKDNQVIKGTKADYIYKVFANEQKDEKDLLTSIAIEVKSENPETVNKKKNSDHYAKLHEDRLKKNCEYALLVSELEWDVVNDAPIRKINEYEKMYLVRPQYFMVFIHIVTALSMKYQEILLKHNVEEAKFKESKEILLEFEEIKANILDTTVKYINAHIEEIIKSANTIMAEGKKILDSAIIIKETHINTLINKITNFKINKIIKTIENLD